MRRNKYSLKMNVFFNLKAEWNENCSIWFSDLERLHFGADYSTIVLKH